MRTRRHIAPLLGSLGAHAVVIALLLRAVTRPAPVATEPVRLVFVEPPPPPPAVGTPGGAVTPPVPETPAPSRTQPAPAPVATRPRPEPARPQRPPRPPSRPPQAERSSDGGGKQAGSETGVREGMPGDVSGGVAGGVVGGRGSALPRASEVAMPPVVVRRVTPRYPREARAKGAAGLVLLEAVLDHDGRVEDRIRVLRSVPMLDAAAVEALRQWRFRPARDQTRQTVRVVLEVPMRFVLE